MKEALELVQQPIEKVGPCSRLFAKETVLLDAKLAKEPVAAVEVQAIQIGPAVFDHRPGRVVRSTGPEIKAKSPFKFTFPVELANGCVAYVPTEECFGPHGGGDDNPADLLHQPGNHGRNANRRGESGASSIR